MVASRETALNRSADCPNPQRAADKKSSKPPDSFVPQGHLKIARSFNCGWHGQNKLSSPAGTTENLLPPKFCCPFSFCSLGERCLWNVLAALLRITPPAETSPSPCAWPRL